MDMVAGTKREEKDAIRAMRYLGEAESKIKKAKGKFKPRFFSPNIKASRELLIEARAIYDKVFPCCREIEAISLKIAKQLGLKEEAGPVKFEMTIVMRAKELENDIKAWEIDMLDKLIEYLGSYTPEYAVLTEELFGRLEVGPQNFIRHIRKLLALEKRAEDVVAEKG